MGKLFRPNSWLMNGLTFIGDLITLNLLWLLCCIPIVTIGPSTTALYSVTRQLVSGNAPAVAKSFFQAFRNNFKQAFILSLVLLFFITLAVGYFSLAVTGALAEYGALQYLCWFAIAVISIVSSYAFPLLATFETTTLNTLKNAIVLPLSNLLIAIIVTFLNLFPLILLLVNTGLFLRLAILWTLLWTSLTAFFNTKLLNRQFTKFTTQSMPNE